MEPEQEPNQAEPAHVTVWPVGFAVGVVCLLVGIVVSWWIAAVGGAIALVFGALWIADVVSGHRLRTSPAPVPAAAGAGAGAQVLPVPERYPRNKFLEGATLGIGALIGLILMLPPIFLALIPPFLKQHRKGVDIGPWHAYPEGQWVIATFLLSAGGVNARTAFIRNNGLVNTSNGAEPSFTIISSRCVHLGCPTQPNGLFSNLRAKTFKAGGEPVRIVPAQGVSGFGCPCHGGQYDSEGNRTAGPPVRALDRYNFSINDGRLILGKRYSVAYVDGTGADAKIHAFGLASPGNHVDGWEQILYPLQPPS